MIMSSKLMALLKFCEKALLKKLRNLCSNNNKLILKALLKFCCKALLKKLVNLSMGPRRGPWRFWSWPSGLDWYKLLSGCFRVLIWTECSDNWTRNYKVACLLWEDSEGEDGAFLSPGFCSWFLQAIFRFRDGKLHRTLQTIRWGAYRARRKVFYLHKGVP